MPAQRRTARQPQLSLAAPYVNRGLFASNFLQNHLPNLPEWREAQGSEEAFRRVSELYQQKQRFLETNPNESQTEHEFIQPLLDILWGRENYRVQPPLKTGDIRGRPDYALFLSGQQRDEADKLQGEQEYWRHAVALADAKPWASSLDRQRGSGENPSAQVCHYLYRSQVRWGILTNGRHWRLFERDRSSPGGIYFEVDLQSILDQEDVEGFKTFYLFFRREALLPDKTGVSFVEKVFQGSVEHATEVGNRLKDAVYDALRYLMNGFLAHPANRLHAEEGETLQQVHENSLIVLYRLLFLLYAEDRDLLPCDDPCYRTYSLRELHREVNASLRNSKRYLPGTTVLWARLCNLFQLIDRGFQEGGRVVVPAYNGGLFSPSHYPHIAHTPQEGIPRWEIGDSYLAEAIDRLAYERERWNEPGTLDVDYATLDVQHLGSIYEGLLELQPRIAQKPMVETIEQGKVVFKERTGNAQPARVRGQQAREVQPGEVYLVTNRGERKATGSYYTPRYIVNYIVENTLAPLVNKAAEQVAQLRPEVEEEIQQLQGKQRKWQRSGMPDADKEVARLQEQIEQQKRRLLEPYLSIKVLDPAMGSGHFLVGAADFLSLAMATDPNLLAPEQMGDEEPQAFYKRLVVEHCLYGVDLNPLAVELAKLSLWLHTVSKQKALSFLDHHLRCGNSLIGARIEEDLSHPPPAPGSKRRSKSATNTQLVLGFEETLTGTHLHTLLDAFRRIVESPTGNAETERQKDRWYREMDAVRNRFRAVANCWLAPFFGVPVTAQQYERAVDALSDVEKCNALTQEQWFQKVQEVARRKRFFHWELEFPEAFFHPHGFKPQEERGFDAVIGNPPWLGLRTGEIPQDLLEYLRSRYRSAVGQFDLASVFLDLSCALSSSARGCIGTVIPKRILTNESYEVLRYALAIERRLTASIDLRVAFEGVDNDAAILISAPASDSSSTLLLGRRVDLTSITVSAVDSAVISKMPFYIVPVNSDVRTIKLISDLVGDDVVPLGGLMDIARGAECGMNHPSISRIETPDSLPLVDHLDVCRYSIVHGGWFIDPSKIDQSTMKSPDIYRKVPKLLVRFLSASLIVARDDYGYASTNLVYHAAVKQGVPYALNYLLSLLCSRLLNFWYRNAFQNEEVKFPHVQKSHIERLPIRRIDFVTPAEERAKRVQQGQSLYEQYLKREVALEDVLAFVEQQVGCTPDHADAVHDLLAYLAEQMTTMHREKAEEMSGFLRWLETELGTSIDALQKKTAIRNYHESSLQDLLQALRANSNALGEKVHEREFQQALRKEFEKSMGKLNPLQNRIAMTDRLIDHIVYRLYGLSEEEIAIVEASEHSRQRGEVEGG